MVLIATMKFLVLLSVLAYSVDASTRVAVLEFGKGGAVRRTAVRDSETSVNGVVSFWNALHRTGRRQLQYAGMTVVPDMFQKASSGIVIGLSGSVDLDDMINVASWISEDGAAVGHMEVEGRHCSHMMSKLDDVQEIDNSVSFKTVAVKEARALGLSGVKTVVTSSNAAEIDQELGAVFKEFERVADETGNTIVVHLVVDEDDSYSRRRLQSRRLEDVAAGDDANANQNNNAAAVDDATVVSSQSQYSGFYGYGYYNAYGEWVTPYKTMFQIQYFNVVLWTAVALVVTLFYTIYLMTNMSLEADTLLFGESAKMIGDD
jgi:hypothetical protein